MKSKQVLIALFFATIILLPMATFLLPKQDFSEMENRQLAEAPEPALENIRDRSFMTNAEDFMADHMFFRDRFVKTKTRLELASGKREIGGVFIGNNRLMENIKEPDANITQKNVDAVNQFAKKYSGKLETSIMLVPTAVEFYPSEIPPFAAAYDQTEYIQRFYKKLRRVSTVDAYTPLAAATGGNLFYRTDHHWTSYGAYTGYTALSKALGFKAATHDMFNIEHASHDFLGTLYSKTAYGEQWADNIDLYTYAPGDVVTDVVRYNGKNTQTYPSIFFRDNLEGKDKYTVFLGQNIPVIKIKTNLQNGKKLLIFKDSYANSMMQFLPLHYEEIALVDLRYLNQPLSEFLNIGDYQQALFLYNVGNFTDDSSISKITQY